ncbi:MAG: site-specific DNA-methyltransferase [Gammaproteobacteria bacterium]|nr:site-specific DNA-methyltransferase [Gammaproteobacteria bacterium]
MLEFKSLPLATDHRLTVATHELIKQFNASFDPSDLQIDVANGMPVLQLRQVDLRAMRHVAERLAGESGEGEAALLREAVSSVEAVRSYGIQSGKRNYVDYNRERKVKGRHEKERRRGRHYYANDREFDQSGNAAPPELTDRIVLGDAKEVLARLPDNCVDLVFTSPPYNFGLDYTANPDDQRWDEYFEQLFAVFNECIRVLKFGGRIAVNVQPLFSDYIPSHHIISNFFVERRLIWKGEILWEKNNYNCKYTAWGSWKSPSSPYLKYTWEFIEVFCKGSLKAKGASEDADISADDFKRWVNAKWSIAPERNMREYGHPAMFPEELASRVLQLFSFRNAFVVDPFAGVGTVPVVARNLGRHYLGVDISDEYCAAAERRLAKTLL